MFVRVIEIKSGEERQKSFPVLRALRESLEFAEFERVVSENRSYRFFAVADSDAYVCVAGVSILENLFFGRHLIVNDLVTLPSHRSKGYGAFMLSFLEGFARDNNCRNIILSSGFARTGAHRFYEEKAGFKKTAFLFVKQL